MSALKPYKREDFKDTPRSAGARGACSSRDCAGKPRYTYTDAKGGKRVACADCGARLKREGTCT